MILQFKKSRILYLARNADKQSCITKKKKKKRRTRRSSLFCASDDKIGYKYKRSRWQTARKTLRTYCRSSTRVSMLAPTNKPRFPPIFPTGNEREDSMISKATIHKTNEEKKYIVFECWRKQAKQIEKKKWDRRDKSFTIEQKTATVVAARGVFFLSPNMVKMKY